MMQEQSLVWRNDLTCATAYLCRMVPRYDIYLTEWLRASKKKQADVVRDLEWNKAKVSLIASGKQQYMRDDVNELARYLNARPYELLMPPDEAMALRQLQASAKEVVTLAHDAGLDREQETNDIDGSNSPRRRASA